MIIEGLLTTSHDRAPHVAMMGAAVDDALTQWTLRPYPTSTTHNLLRINPHCTFHVVDDALLVARLVCRQPVELPYRRMGQHWILESACRWYALQVASWAEGEPSRLECRLIDKGFQREFWGWNRAKHAILEAAILCSRLQFLGPDVVHAEMVRLESLVSKTGGEAERQAWSLLEDHVASRRTVHDAG